MARLILTLGVVVALAAAALFWPQADGQTPRSPDPAADLSALRLQATDLQRSVETLARSPAPDPAELAALAARLEALTRSLELIESQTGR